MLSKQFFIYDLITYLYIIIKVSNPISYFKKNRFINIYILSVCGNGVNREEE